MLGGDFLDRVAKASPGEVIEYARGDRPPADLVRGMRPLVEAGILHPTQHRDGGQIRFLVQRGAGDLTSALSRRPRRGVVRRRRVRKSSISMVFECVASAARKGAACPTNEELALACGLSGRLAASYRMRKLVAEGRIAIEDRHPYGRRVVTILTGPLAGRSTCEAKL